MKTESKASKLLPCGWTRTGDLREHIAHCRICSGDFCKGRLVEYKKVAQMIGDDLRNSKAKAEPKEAK